MTLANGVSMVTNALLAPLVKALGDETVARGYEIRRGVTGSYVVRLVRGSTTAYSHHAWGTAVDVNWDRNPMTSGPIVTDMPPWVVTLWEAHGYEWGGRWQRKDPMHFQFTGTPADVSRLLARVHRSTSQPAHRVVVPSPSRTGDRGPVVVQLQNMLRFLGIGHVTVADGVYGPQTAAAVRALQGSLRVTVDGVYGPRTAAAFQGWLDTH